MFFDTSVMDAKTVAQKAEEISKTSGAYPSPITITNRSGARKTNQDSLCLVVGRVSCP